jgi:hypothetical protein
MLSNAFLATRCRCKNTYKIQDSKCFSIKNQLDIKMPTDFFLFMNTSITDIGKQNQFEFYAEKLVHIELLTTNMKQI